MIQKIVIDTGPLIAYLNPKDTHQTRAIEVLSNVNLPLFSCEASCHPSINASLPIGTHVSGGCLSR